MNADGFYISDEWAKQLAFDIWGTLDFLSINIIKVHQGLPVFRVPVVSDVSWRDYIDESLGLPDIEDIRLEKIGDPINSEYTHMGYGEKTNTLILGLSYPVIGVE